MTTCSYCGATPDQGHQPGCKHDPWLCLNCGVVGDVAAHANDFGCTDFKRRSRLSQAEREALDERLRRYLT